MKRRLVCLTLSILMLLSCLLTGCAQKTTEEEKDDTVDNSAKTITMWVVTEEETTEQAQKLVNEAFTKITKAKFKTNVVIKFCTEDEYYEKLTAAIEANQADIELKAEHDKAKRVYLRNHKGQKPNDELEKDFYAENPQYAKFQNVEEEDDEEAEVTEEETTLNELGIAEIKYPDAKENQVDIFYLSGYENYVNFNEKEWLASLNEELATSSKKLKTYISSSLLKGVEIEGSVYAIPNNVAIGEYTYMMVEKQLMDMYKQKINNVETVLDLGTFLNDVTNYNAANGYTPESPEYVVPLASTFEECMRMLVWYWELNYTDMSVYETYFDEETGRNYVLQVEYEVETEVTKDDGTTSTTVEKFLTSKVTPDVLYLTDEDGNYLDADGNVLNYRYEIDTEKGFVDNGKGKVSSSAKAAGALYLVDENGYTVTAENDKRVKIEAETAVDSYGNTKATYNYAYEKSSDFSVLGSLQINAANRTRGGINLGFNSLFTQSDYREVLSTLMNYEYKNYYGEVQEGQRAAVSFVKGDARIKQEYEENGVYVDPETGREYYALVAAYPEATEEELYGNMFAVYANSNNIARSMKVLTYLNTNADFRNLLQYGIKGQHYELEKITTTDELGIETDKYQVKLLPGSPENKYGTYRMDIEKTGNCFIATPTAEMGGPDAWVYAKMQNNDSLINPLLGFDFNTMTADADYGLDVALIDHIKQLSEDTWAQILQCQSLDDLQYLMENDTNGFKKIYAASAGDVKLNKATNPAYDPSMPQGADGPSEQVADTSGSSPYTVYQSWLTQYGYAYVPAADN
ncbi:MAG: hypothetical protein IJW00_00650 [Clostridia bacterium]|nr:hypothetical protein [Clostridia bacterium]